MARYIDAEKLALEPDEQGGANGVLIIERQNGKTMRMRGKPFPKKTRMNFGLALSWASKAL